MTDPGPTPSPESVTLPRPPKRPIPVVAIIAAVVALVGAVIGIGIAVSSGGSSSGQLLTASDQGKSAGHTTRAPIPTQTFKGQSSDIVSIKDPGFAGILIFSCPRCSGNTVVETNGSEGLLVNEIGPYVGRRWLNARAGSRTTEIDITADDKWELTVGGVELAKIARGSSTAGHGDDVVVMGGEGDRATVSHQGKGNFAIEVITASGVDLAVNEIGSYSGTIRLTSPSLVQVTAGGDWSIAWR